MSYNRSQQITTGSLLATRAALQQPTLPMDTSLGELSYDEPCFIDDSIPGLNTRPGTTYQDSRFTNITVSEIPGKSSGTPQTQVGHLTRLMDYIISSYQSLPTLSQTADTVLCKLSSMRTTLKTFSQDIIFANLLRGSDPLTRMIFERAVENHPYLKTLSNVDKIHTLKIILHTINIAILLINLVVMFSQASVKSVIALQIASIITSITLFFLEIYSKHKAVPESLNLEDMVTELLQSKLDSQFVSRYDSRRNQILVDLFTNYGKKFNLPNEILNVARDKLSGQTSDIILCPETSQYFDYAVEVAEKTSNLMNRFPAIRDSQIVNRVRFDPGIGDGLHAAFSHFRCIQEMHPERLREINIMESDWIYWTLIVQDIRQRTPYKNFAAEGFPTLNHWFASLGKDGWLHHKSHSDEEKGILPHIGKAACALLALVSAGLTTLTGKSSFTDCFKKVKTFFKDWKDSKSLITGFKASFIGLAYDMFDWDIGNLHATKQHAKEIQKTLISCSTLSPHLISANPLMREKILGYQTEAAQVLIDLKTFDSEDLKDLIRDLSMLLSTTSKLLADSHVVNSNDHLRPVPVALYLSGHAGSGKTFFVNHILAPYLYDLLNMTPPVEFSVDASGHFNLLNPDTAQHLFSDEVAAKVDDPLITCLNKLISESPFTAPGAFVKDIKLTPKLISLCNNEKEISNATSKDSFIRALTSRLTQFKVVHHEFKEGGSQERESLTRLPNMENVDFIRIKTDLQGKTIETSEKLTALQVCHLIGELIIKAQKEFEKKKALHQPKVCATQGPFSFSLTEFSQSNIKYKKYVADNMHPLFSLTNKLTAIHDLYPLSEYLKSQICVHLEDGSSKRIGSGVDVLCCQMVQSSTGVDFLANKMLVTQQSAIKQTKEPLFLHIIGEPGVGKTTAIKDQVDLLRTATSYDTYFATAFSLDIIKKDITSSKSPIILILDDVVTQKPIDFQGLYDHIPKGSIVIITSNLKFEDCSFIQKAYHRTWDMKKVVLDRDISPPTGWYRRLCLPFPVLGNGVKNVAVPSTVVINVDQFEPLVTADKIKQWLEGDFFDYISQPLHSEISIHYNTQQIDMPKPSNEVYIQYKNRDTFISVMSSQLNAEFHFGLAWKGMSRSITVTTADLPKPQDLDSVKFTPYNEQISVEAYLLSLFPTFQKIFPDAKGATIEIAGSFTATLENGSIYTTASNPLLQENIDIRADGIVVSRSHDRDFFTIEEVKHIISMRLTDISLVREKHDQWSILLLLCNKDQLRQKFIQMGLVSSNLYEINLEDPILSKFKEMINSAPFKIFCGVFITIFTLITISSLATLAYGLYQMFSKKDFVVDNQDIYFTPQANDFNWADEVENDEEYAHVPKPKREFFPVDDTFEVSAGGSRTIGQEDYEKERKTKRTNISKRFGGFGHVQQENTNLPKTDPKRYTDDVNSDGKAVLTPAWWKANKHDMAAQHPFLMASEFQKNVKVDIEANEQRKKRVNYYVSQMVKFESSTGQSPKADFKVEKLIKAQCRVTFEDGRLLGSFIGENYVATCAHLVPKDKFDPKKPIYVTEIIDGAEHTWEAYIVYHGFRKSFNNKFTDLLVAYIPDKAFVPRPNLIKYMKTVQDFVTHESNQDSLDTAVTYLTKDNLKREILLQTRIGSTNIACFDDDGKVTLDFNSPLLSHELTSNQGLTNLYQNTFVPGSCGLIVYTRDEPSGSGWICGMHAAINNSTQEVEAFPLYRDMLVYIIKRHKALLADVSRYTVEERLASFAIQNVPPPTDSLQEKLFCLGRNEIVCCVCCEKLTKQNYLNHICKEHSQQGINAALYQFNGETLPVDIPDWWQEILTDLVTKPNSLPECALDGNQIVRKPALTYLGRSWFRMPDNIKPRYKLSPYSRLIPYPIEKRPAALHPSQVPDTHQKYLDPVYKIRHFNGTLLKGAEAGKSIQSGQIKLMHGGVTDDQCLSFFGKRNLLKASQMFLRKFHKIVSHPDPRLRYRFLTLDEVVNGITNQNHPLSKCIYNMDLDSESGPTCKLLFPKMKGLKRDHFERAGRNFDGSDKYQLTPDAAKFWYRVRDNAKKGVVTFAPDHLKLKNENLKAEKALIGKTRAYISRDMFGMMLEKTCFGFLQGLFHLNGVKSFSAIGANPQVDFPEILQRFADNRCNNLICYDVSRWDKNTLRILLEELFKAILSYLTQQFQLNESQINTLKVAIAQVLTTYFQTGNDFYMNGRSMPSGTYVTALINTCLNEYLLCLFICYVAEKENRNPDKILDSVQSVFMGDDGVIAFPDSLVEFFEPKRLQQVYAMMNVELTSTTKDGSDIGIVSLSDFEFCSRTVETFNLPRGVVTTFPLKEISVKSDSHWITSDTPETKLSICRTKLYEACLHGPEFYQQEVECVKIILSTLPADCQSEILILDWESQLESVLFSASAEERIAKKDNAHSQQSYIRTTKARFTSPSQRQILPLPSMDMGNQCSIDGCIQDTLRYSTSSDNLIDLSESFDAFETVLDDSQVDYISRVQERCQSRKLPVPEYFFQRIGGPDHIPAFRCTSTLTDSEGDLHYIAKEASTKRKAKWMVAREFYLIQSSSTSYQMETSKPTAAASPSGDASFEGMVTTAPTAAPTDIIQPSLQPLTDVLNYGDPREMIDVIKTQIFPIRDIVFNAAATPGSIIAKIPYGPEYLAPPLAEYFAKHKFFKGMFYHTLVLYSNATVTGAIRISHVKDIDKDIYTRNELVETNHSEIVQLNQVSLTANTARNYAIDYAGVADMVLPTKEILEGTYSWRPSRPGIVVTMEVPVQQIYGQNLNLTLQHYTAWGTLVVSTPIVTPLVSGIKPGAKTLLEATQGMTLNSLVSSLEPGLEESDIVFTTDGNSYPSTVFTKTREYTTAGISYGKAATIEFKAITGKKTTDADVETRNTPQLASACISTTDLAGRTGTVYARLFLLEGKAPLKAENLQKDSFEKALTVGYRTTSPKSIVFPFPDPKFTNTDSTIATIQNTFLESYNERNVTALQTFSANPFKLLGIKCFYYDGNDVLRQRSLDLAKRAHNINTKAIICSIGALHFRLYVIDIDFEHQDKDGMFDYGSDQYVISDIFSLDYTPPTTGVSTIPLVAGWNALSRLPSGCKSFSLLNPQSSAITTPNGNEGLPTVVDVRYTNALIQFLDVNTPKGQVCKLSIMQAGTGRITATLYYSSEYKQLFVYAPTTATLYSSYIGQPSSSYVISSVSFQTPSESFTQTDDSSWSNRQVIPAQRNYYSAQMMLATALQAGLGAVGGIASGIGSAVQQQQEFKRQQMLQQERLDYMNRWNELSAQTQLKTNEITSATNLAMNQGTNTTQFNIAGANNANAWAIAQANNSNRIDLAKISQDTTLAGFANQKDMALLNQATVLGAKGIDAQIAQGNNATTIEAANIGATAQGIGNALSFAGGLANTGVGIAKVVTDYLQGDKERENRLEQIHVRGDETRKTIDHNLAMQGGNLASSQ